MDGTVGKEKQFYTEHANSMDAINLELPEAIEWREPA